MRLIKRSFIMGCSFVLFSFASLSANPNPPTAYVVLSEVQITDSAHWTVEVRYDNPFPGALAPDSLTTEYTLVYNNVRPAFRPKIKVNSNGYALISPQDYSPSAFIYPYVSHSILFHPGDTVNLHFDYTRAMNPGDTVAPGDTAGYIWQCVIDKDLKPTQSMAAFQEAVIIQGYNFGDYVMWCKSDSPTIGSANNTVGIYGVIKGFVCDKDSQPLTNFVVSYDCCSYCLGQSIVTCTIKTDTNGYFIMPSLASADQKTFSFPGASIKTFGPFSVEPECTLNVICKLDDYVTAMRNPALRSPMSSLKIVGVTKNNSSVLIAFNGSNEDGDYNVAVFSLSGKKLFSSVVSNTGSGTYSVAWNDVTHSGYYIARISSENGSVERKFLLR